MKHAPVVLVTGASRGIGAATARNLLSRGCRVAAAARSREAVQAAMADIPSMEDSLLILAGDVSQPEDCRRWVADTAARFSRLDALVNNAGILEPVARIVDAESDAWHANLAVNLLGPFYLAQAAIPHLRITHEGYVRLKDRAVLSWQV